MTELQIPKMITTIPPGSTNFQAVGYNKRKVAKGIAQFLEMQDFGTVGLNDKPTIEEQLLDFAHKYLKEMAI